MNYDDYGDDDDDRARLSSNSVLESDGLEQG